MLLEDRFVLYLTLLYKGYYTEYNKIYLEVYYIIPPFGFRSISYQKKRKQIMNVKFRIFLILLHIYQ